MSILLSPQYFPKILHLNITRPAVNITHLFCDNIKYIMGHDMIHGLFCQKTSYDTNCTLRCCNDITKVEQSRLFQSLIISEVTFWFDICKQGMNDSTYI